jgi:hypothetical protein
MPLRWHEVVEGVSALPHVESGERDGARTLSVGDQVFARDQSDSMIVLCSPYERDVILESGDPAVQQGPTIEGQEFVRVRYQDAEMDAEILELVGEGWRIAEQIEGLEPK